MKILIVCTGNTCRSPMAEGILKSLILKQNLNIEVTSAGISAFDGEQVSINAVKALNNIIDISGTKATLIHKGIIEEADLILTMTKSHKKNLLKKFPETKDKIYLLYEYAFGEQKDIIDPFGGRLEDYERARDEITLALEEIVRKF